MRDPYEVLGVSPGASDDEIKPLTASWPKNTIRPEQRLRGGRGPHEGGQRGLHPAHQAQGTDRWPQRIRFRGRLWFIRRNRLRLLRQLWRIWFLRRLRSYGGGYGSSGGGGQGGFDFGGFGFDFEDLFGGGQRRNYQSTAYTENDPELRSAAQAVLAGRYSEALGLLRGATNRKAAWYYWSARANMGLGNRIAALNDARTAVNMAPDEPLSANCLRSSTRAAAPTGNAGHRGALAPIFGAIPA